MRLLLCVQRRSTTCHRAVLVAHFARDQLGHGTFVHGNIESRAEADFRLLKEYKLEKEDGVHTMSD